MTREEFNQLVRYDTRNVQHGIEAVRAAVEFRCEAMADTRYSMVKSHVKEMLCERLWRELYGQRLKRYHELLDDLMMCDQFSPKFREIIQELHEVAPLEPKQKQVEYAAAS